MSWCSGMELLSLVHNFIDPQVRIQAKDWNLGVFFFCADFFTHFSIGNTKKVFINHVNHFWGLLTPNIHSTELFPLVFIYLAHSEVYSDKIQNETWMNLSEQTDGLSNWLCKNKSSKKVCKNLYGLSEFCTFSAPMATHAASAWCYRPMV